MWSKLVYTELGSYAKQKYESNRLSYHNWEHVLNLYEYLEKEGAPYYQALDLAVLLHDIIYDSRGEKELRSAEWMKAHCSSMFSSEVIDEAYRLIMLTAEHKVDGSMSFDDLWIVKADLAGFLDVGTTIINFGKLLEEARFLYPDKTDSEIGKATRNFLVAFLGRMDDNYENTLDKYFLGMHRGVFTSIDLTSLLN